MKSITEVFRRIVLRFKNQVDNIMMSGENERMNLRMYNAEIRKERTAELESVEKAMISRLRETATNNINKALDRVYIYFHTAVSESDPAEISRLEAIFKASEGHLSDYELGIIKENFSGSYWAIKWLSNRLADGSYESALNGFPVLDVQSYFNIFKEIEASCLGFINSYEGPDSLTSTSQEAVASLILLADNKWEDWKLRIDNTCEFFTNDSLIASDRALSANERKMIEYKLDPSKTATAERTRENVLKAAAEDKNFHDILLRSRYAPIVEEYDLEQQNKKIAEMAKEYASAGKTVDEFTVAVENGLKAGTI